MVSIHGTRHLFKMCCVCSIARKLTSFNKLTTFLLIITSVQVYGKGWQQKKGLVSSQMYTDDRPDLLERRSHLKFNPSVPFQWHKSLVVSPSRKEAKIFRNTRALRHHRRNVEILSRDTRNLHEPQFEHSEYQVHLNESISVNSRVLQVRATDQDLDVNGMIRYELRNTNNFRIDQSGVIYTNAPLDYESSGGIYRFSVLAKNPTANSEGTLAAVVVHIRDSPEIPLFDSNSYSFSISEFSSLRDYVGTVVARDEDNDFVVYSLDDVHPDGLFVINRNDGIISIGSRGGFPVYTYRFDAVATDQQGHSNNVPVTVNIIDENTNKPMFENCSGYNDFKIQENQNVPHDVFTVKATDADYGKNGEVTYSLLNDPPQFAIDPITGQLSVQQRLDRDNGPKRYFLTVIAKDLAENFLRNSCAFTLVVEDINDNSPVFDSMMYIQTVPSDTRLHAQILRLTASDADDGSNAEIKYSISGKDEDRDYFSIDESSGYIALTKSLTSSMANTKTFEFVGTAVDSGTPPLQSMVNISLQIVTAGDMPPSVISQIPQLAKVSEDAIKNTNIISLCARSNSASNIVYMDLANGQSPETNSEGTFDIAVAANDTTLCPRGQTRGNIFLATPNLDFEEIQAYTINVQLTNDVGARSEYSLEVMVVDVNDNPPVLQEPYSGSVSENNDAKTLVMHIQSIDKDASPQFRQLTYFFKDASPVVTDNFEINVNTGELWTKKSLDREKKKQYRISIGVTDGINVRDRHYWVVVNDQNDEPPIFNREEGIYETEVYENLSVGKDTGIKLVVEDPDILNKFTYQIVEGNEQRKFKINSKTGVLTVSRILDYDSPSNDRNFTLQVRVSDGKSYNTTEVKIAVLNVNDIVPEFEQKNYNVEVTENQDCDKKILKVVAHDPDHPTDGDIVYRFIRKEEQGNFTINRNTGEIAVIGCLDRETVSPFGLLTINPVAFDEGGSDEGLNSKPAQVRITIRDVNDNHPYIESPPQARVGIMENLSPSVAPKTTILLNDWDSNNEGNGCPCTLSFDESTSAEVIENFEVVEGNGSYSLVIRKSLDREMKKFYNIPFRTTDRKGLSGIRNLVVTVGDQNDSPMTDGDSQITVYNYMNSFPDMEIGFVYVTDADDYDVDDKNFELDLMTAPMTQSYFTVDLNSGNLTMKRGTPPGDYTAVVKVTDNVRKEEAIGTVHIRVIDLPESAVMQSGSFLVSGISAVELISQSNLNVYEGTSLYDRLKVELGIVFEVSPENVDLFTLLDVTKDNVEGVEVRFNVHSSPYYTSSHVNGLLQQNKVKIENNLGINIPVIDYNLCLYENYMPCNGSSCQQELRADSRNPLFISAETTTIVGVKVSQNYTCMCGHLDPVPKACPENYCYNDGICAAALNGTLSCSCLDSYNYGPRCELLTARLEAGFAWFEPLKSCDKTTLQLTFQTQQSSALLLYNGPLVESSISNEPRDFIYLILRDWTVEAYIDLGRGTNIVSVRLNPSETNDYEISLTWTSTTLKMSIPNCGLDSCSKTVRIYSGGTSLLNVGGPLQLGGLAPMVPLRSLGASYQWDMELPSVDLFVGCMSNLQYNNVIYDMNKTSYYEHYSRTCADVSVQPQMKMSSESVFIIVGSLLVLLVLVLLILILLRRRKKAQSYPEHLNDIVKETIGQTDIEGYGERDMTHFDLKFLRVTPDGQLINGHGNRELPDVTRQHPVKKAPIARLSEGLSVGDFIADNTKKVDKEPPEFDDCRHYCYEGDTMSIASLSSLGSGTSADDQNFNYLDDWGPRFKQLADLYRPKADEEEDSEFEFSTVSGKPPKPPKPPKPQKPLSTTLNTSVSPSDKNSDQVAAGAHPRLIQDTDRSRIIRGDYHETLNPLNSYSGSKESWC